MKPEEEAFGMLHDKAAELFEVEAMQPRDSKAYLVLVHAMQYLLNHYLYTGGENNSP